MKTPVNIANFADEVLAHVEHADRIKTAEIEAVRVATPRFQSEIGQLMHKVAEGLRNESNDVTYADLAAYLEKR